MKRIRLIGLLSLLILQWPAVFSQENYSFQPDKVTQYEMDMTEHPVYKDAEAVVIYSFGDFYMRGDDRTGGFLLNKKRQTKIKILKESGLDYADFEISLYNNGERAEELDITKAIVYNIENGALKTTTLDPKKVFTEKINNHWMDKKFTMPNVKKGSVIELEYTIRTPFFFNMGDWMFQRRIPVIYSKLRYRAIPYYEYSYIMKGANRFDEFQNTVLGDEIRFGRLLYKEVEYVFGMKNVPPFKDEEFISSPKDYLISLSFQLSKINYPTGGSRNIMSTWPDLCDEFLKYPEFGKYINSSEKEAKKILPGLNLSGLSGEEKLEKITRHVKSGYNWSGQYGKYAYEKLSDFLKSKKGNDANLNLFLTGLLKGAGLDATPVILSTRSNGAISPLHPFDSFFDYVITLVNIDGKSYFIDATEPLLHYDELPTRCMNVHGLLVKPKSEEWIMVSQDKRALIEKHFDIKRTPDKNTLDVNTKYICSGNGAYVFRTIYLNEKNNLSDYLKKTNNVNVIGDVEVENGNELELPMIFSFAHEAEVEETPEKLFIAPFCKLSISDNPFKQNSRTLPVDLIYLRGEKYKSRIEIPLGYKIDFLPEKGQFNNKMMAFNYSVKVNDDNVIEIEGEYALHKSVYAANEYQTLQNLMTIAIDKFSEMIVFLKE